MKMKMQWMRVNEKIYLTTENSNACPLHFGTDCRNMRYASSSHSVVIKYTFRSTFDFTSSRDSISLLYGIHLYTSVFLKGIAFGCCERYTFKKSERFAFSAFCNPYFVTAYFLIQ